MDKNIFNNVEFSHNSQDNKKFLAKLQGLKAATYAAGFAGIVLVLGSLSGVYMLIHQSSSHNLQVADLALVNSATPSISPLIYGTNMSMDNSQDQFLTSAAATTQLQNIHTQLIRFPMRDTLTANDYTVAMNKIKQIGATPIITVHGAVYSGGDPYPADSTVLNIAKTIFPTQTVYVDFGNEEDLGGASVQKYVSGTFGWNTEIPKFKQITGSNFKYGGPVNFQYNQSYIDTFVATANPSPDYIVWHAYAGSCGHNNGTGQPDSQARFLASVDNWGAHIQQISNDFATQNGGAHKGMPILIDEWNYASDLEGTGSATPCYSNDQTFINTFYNKAFNMFIASGVYGVIGTAQYEAFVNQDSSLINGNNAVTVQGQAFKASYEANIGNTPPPPGGCGTSCGASKLMGVNFSGPEFSGSPIYDDSSYLGYKYFAGIKLNLIRMPFLWERMQPAFNAPLDSTTVQKYGMQLGLAQSNNEKVILDMHNYARYKGAPLATTDSTSFANAWKAIAAQFGSSSYPATWGYEVMNEPHDLAGGCAQWETLAQAAVNGIRQVDKTHYILIPGYSWQSAANWPSASGCLGNVTDPANKMYFAAHQYFDADSSGTYGGGQCPSSGTVGTQRVTPFLQWLAQNHKQGLMTEFGTPASQCWQPVLDDFMKTIYNDSNIVGSTAWAGFPTGIPYNLNLTPTSATQGTPQDAILAKYPTTGSAQTATYSCTGLSGTVASNPMAFNFTATAQVTGGAVLNNADFNFGDGNTANAVTPSSTNVISSNHTYSSAGTYNVAATLHFTASGSSVTATCSTQVVASSNSQSYSGTLQAVKDASNAMLFHFTGQTATSGGATFTSADIDFGDGKNVTGLTPAAGQTSVQTSHTYTSGGTYTSKATFSFLVSGLTKTTTATAQVTVSGSGGGGGGGSGGQKLVAKDTFERANRSGWGTASDGQKWGADANSSTSIFGIKNNVGIVSNTSDSLGGILGPNLKDSQIVFTGRISKFNYGNFGGLLRYKDANNWYKAYLDGTSLVIQKRVNANYTKLKYVAFKAYANTNYTVRFQAVGNMLSAKVWVASGTEPSGWTVTLTDNSLQSGYDGLRALPQAGIVVGYYYFAAYQL